MIHHKNFPFHEPDVDTDIIHVSHSRSYGTMFAKTLFFLIVIGAVFFAAKTLFNLGKGETYEAGTPVIEANPEPYKTQPDEPGGMQIPNMDKEIYGKIKMPINQSIEAPIDVYGEENSNDDPLGRLLEKENINADTYAKTDNPEVVRPQPKTINSRGETITTSSIGSEGGDRQKAKRIDVEKVLAKKNETEIWLQLASFKSETEATKAWQETRERNSDILGNLTIKVTKSDMKDQGALYRLQAGSVEDESAAKNLCKKLAARKQNCFYTISRPN